MGLSSLLDVPAGNLKHSDSCVQAAAAKLLQHPTLPSSLRIGNWHLNLHGFQVEVLYSRGEWSSADYISGHLQSDTQCVLVTESAKQYVHFVVTHRPRLCKME